MSTPTPPQGVDPAKMVVFRRMLRRALTENPPSASEVGLSSSAYRAALAGDKMAGWETYERMLEVAGTDNAMRELLLSAWRNAQPPAPARVPSGKRRSGTSTDGGDQALLSIMITAANSTEFNGMVRAFVDISGLKPNQVARQTKIARSQIYALLDPERTALPTKREQVVAILRACRASDDQIRRVDAIWRGLYVSQPPPTSAATDETKAAELTRAPEVSSLPTACDGQAEPKVDKVDLMLTSVVILGGAIVVATNIGPGATSRTMRACAAGASILVGLGLPRAMIFANQSWGPLLRQRWDRLRSTGSS